MKAVRLLPLCVLLLALWCWAVRAQELPPAAKETLDAYEKEAAEVQNKIDEEIRKAVEKTAARLRAIQDRLCKEHKLDEAVAVRDQIRFLKNGETRHRVADLPEDAGKEMKAFAEAEKKIADQRIGKIRDKADAQLQTIQDRFCEEGKLDEALAVRDARRLIRLGITNVLPDPGFLNAQKDDIGKVWYFEVIGDAKQATWGTDVYTTGSHLGATAVHTGVLGDGKKGIIMVTILPGQANYPGTTRNGITSQPWGGWDVSFKVERLPALIRPAPKK